jgi:hypothetical protein
MPTVWPPDLTMKADVPAMFDGDGNDRHVIVGRCRYKGVVNSVEFFPNWTMAGANTNSRTYSLVNRGTSGAGSTVIATLALTSGVDLTKYAAKTITITAANAAVNVGDVLDWVSEHAGTGLPDPGGLVVVQQTQDS